MGNRVVMETILVVSNGGTELFDGVLRSFGCNMIRTNAGSAMRAMQKFVEEFGQGIPVAVIHGHDPDQASILGEQLKQVCQGVRVIALSDRIGQPTREAGRGYDVIIPHNCADLREMMDVFLGYND